MSAFTFVHAADLHLDSPFKGLSIDADQYPRIVQTLREATLTAFDNLVSLCLERQTSFLVISGDVYDARDLSVRALFRFRDGLAKLADANIPVFIVHGNHDPVQRGASSKIEWPPNTHIFDPDGPHSEQVSVADDCVVQISGISHGSPRVQENLARRFEAIDPAGHFHVAVLHCNVGTDTGHEPYAPCTLGDLVDMPVDYWALGHVHTRNVLREGSPAVVYPGTPQGLHIREPGEHGCYLVQVPAADAQPQLEFCPLDAVRWQALDVDIAGIDTIDGLEDAITRKLEAAAAEAEARPNIVRIAVTGRSPLFHTLQDAQARSDVLERIRTGAAENTPFVWIQQLDVACLPEMDIEKRRRQNDLVGRILSIAADTAASEQEIGNVNASALAELYKNTRARKAVDEPTPAEIRAFVQEAQLLCIDLLEETGE